MFCPEFIALYTHQKTKKAKTWQDGVLKISSDGNKATLFDQKGQKLDAVYLRGQKVKPGDDLESDRYLITVEEEKITENSSSDQHGPKEISKQNGRLYPPVTTRQHLPVGLKRKYTGYQGPHQIQKKPATEENEVSSLISQHNLSSSLFPSHLYNTSPLFSIKAPTTLATGFRDNTFSANVKPEQLEQNLPAPSLPAPTLVSLHKKTNNKQRHYDYPETRHQPCNDLADQENTTGVIQITDENYQPTHTISKGIRSKAQILALLRSNTSNVAALKTSSTGQHQPLKDTSGPAVFTNQNSQHLPQDTRSTDLDHVTQETIDTIVTSNLEAKSCWNSYFLDVSTEQEQENNKQRQQDLSCDLIGHNNNTLAQAPAQSLTENRFKQWEGYNAIPCRSRWEGFLPDKKQDNEECLFPDPESLGNNMPVFQTSVPPPLDYLQEDSEELAATELVDKNICPTQRPSYHNTTENVFTLDNKLVKPVLVEMSEKLQLTGTESKKCFEGLSSSATACIPDKEDLPCLNFNLLDDFDLDDMEEDEVQASLPCTVLSDPTAGDGGSNSQEYEEKSSGVIEEKVLSDPFKLDDDLSVGDGR